MIAFTNSYRSLVLIILLLGGTKFLPAQAPADAKSKPAVASSAAAATDPAAKQQPPAEPTSTIVLKQMQSVSAMTASVDKQKIAIQQQLGIPTPADSFFTAAWTTPPAIPLPHLVASCSAMPDADLKPLIEENAKKQEVKPELIRAVIRRESAFYPCAVSERGALGLMQLMPEVAEQFGVDPLDPAQNVRAGAEYLKQLMTRYKGDLKLTLAAYNAGPQRVDAEHKVPDIPETTAYVDSVMKDLNQNGASRH